MFLPARFLFTAYVVPNHSRLVVDLSFWENGKNYPSRSGHIFGLVWVQVIATQNIGTCSRSSLIVIKLQSLYQKLPIFDPENFASKSKKGTKTLMFSNKQPLKLIIRSKPNQFRPVTPPAGQISNQKGAKTKKIRKF